MSAFDMGPAVRPSALIKTTRWSLLLVGIWYGHKRYVFVDINEHVSILTTLFKKVVFEHFVLPYFETFADIINYWPKRMKFGRIMQE